MAAVRKRSVDGASRFDISLTCTGESETISQLEVNNSGSLILKGRFKLSEDIMKVTVSFTTSKHLAVKDKKIKINVDSKELEYSATNIDVDILWSRWYTMGCISTKLATQSPRLYFTFISIVVTLVEDKKGTTLTKLHKDTDFTDFLLTTSEGSIPVHKAYLAAHSDIFKAMLANEWKETAEGQINMKGVTLETLQQLKDYMYLDTLPDVGLCLLLLIARFFYLMEDLEKRCIRKLAQVVTGHELSSLLAFACENNIPELAHAMLVITQDTVVNDAEAIKLETLKNKKREE